MRRLPGHSGTTTPRLRAGIAVLALAASMGLTPAVSAEPTPMGATAATASVVTAAVPGQRDTFAITAPRSVKTGKRFTITGTVSRSLANAASVVEVREAGTWVPIRATKVSSKGRFSIRTQLSEPGRHAVRVRVGTGRSATFSKTVTITAKGKAVTSESPIRMLAHYFAQQEVSAPTGRSARAEADDAAGAKAAAEASDDALSVKSVAKSVGESAAESVGGFGASWILGLIFPGQSTATAAQVEQLEQQIQTGFSNVYQDLSQLQDSIEAVQQQNSQIFSEASLAACNAALSGLESDAQVIEVTFANYQDVLTSDWGKANLVYSGGAGNATAIGNYVYGVGSNAKPSFGPGVNRVEIAVNNLLEQFTQPGPENVITTCADAVASYVIQQEAGDLSTPTDQLPIGTLDTAYATVMQDLVGQYAATINVGLALVGTGDLLAAATVATTTSDGEPVATVPQFISACQDLDEFSCADTAATITTGQQGVSDMWHAAGASWGQVTNGTLQSDLYAYAGQTTFSNGGNAWLTDITTYQQGTFGLDFAPQSPLTSANVDSSSPVAGVTGFADATWGPLVFSPASSAAYNGLIRTNQYSQPYPGAQGGILQACGGPNLTNCSDSTQVGTYLGSAGLSNGGVAVSADDNLILYTGEDYVWYPQFSALSAGLGFMGRWEGADWNQPAVFQLQVNSFVDTGMAPNRGVSAAVNDPESYNFLTGQGNIGNFTLGDIFPFATNGNNAGPSAGDAVATSVTLQNYSDGYNYVAIPCSGWSTSQFQQTGGNWTVMNWLSPGNGTTNAYGDGCGQTSYFPGGGAVPESSKVNTSLTSSSQKLSEFYTQPVLNAVLETQSSNHPDVYSCNTDVTKGPACTSKYTNGWDALPGFVTAVVGGYSPEGTQEWEPVSPQGQTQYLWPVIPTNSTDLAAACPAIPGGASNVTEFSQGTTNIGLPQTCVALLDEWLALTAGQQIGPVFAQIGTPTGREGGTYAATVTLVNDDSASVTLNVGFSASAGATVSSGPSGMDVSSCTLKAVSASSAYVCEVNVPANSSADVTVPLIYASDDTSATLTVAAAGTSNPYLAGASATVTTAAAPNPMVPFGVTGLAATFNSASLNAAGGGTVSLGWTAPYSESPITAYVVTGTGPSGSAPINDTIPASELIAQSNGQLTTTVDIAQGGPWTFTVAAVSSAGAGIPDTLSTYLGEAPPEPPRSVTSSELANGQVALSWQPGMAAPPISSYTVTWWSGTSTTPPASASSLTPGPEWVSSGAGSSMVGTVSVSGTRYFVPPLPTLGPWTFQVTATNTMGASAPATTMVNMQGFVPSRPVGLDVEVTPLGDMNVSWSASLFGVPAPTSYTVGLFAPTSCTQDDACTTPLLQSATVDALGSRGPSEIIDLFSLGANATPGVYTVAVYATNALGDGATTRSTVFITEAFIKRLTAVQDAVDTSKAKISKSIEELNTLECKRGLLTGSACTS